MRRLVVVAVLAFGAAGCTVETKPGQQTETDTSGDLLHDSGVAAGAIRAIEEHVGASPAHLTEVDVYPEYAIVDAQDPKTPDHIDRYQWRDGEVGDPEPVQLSGPQEETDAKLFPSSAVRWADLARFVRKAERRALHAAPIRIEHARANYVSVRRSTSSDADGRITIQISIDGPRRDGYVEMSTGGDVLSVSVN